MMKLTPYWAWYKQRVHRVLHNHTLPSELMVRFWDMRRQAINEADLVIVPDWVHNQVPDFLIPHLPHKVHVKYRLKDVHTLFGGRYAANEQEIWCDAHVGRRDADWLYLGKNEWAFRTAEQACEFSITWG